MSRVIVITSGKGGVGKTTTTANLGSALSQKNKKTVIIDADIGLRNLDVVLGLENRIVFDLIDVIEGRCKYQKALIRDKRFNNLHLIPAAQTRDKDAIKAEDMKKLCEDLSKEFDFILIDCPAGIENGFKNAIAGANEAIVVTTPEVSAVRDADRIIGLLESSGIENTKLLINRIRMDMVRAGNMLGIEDVLEILAIDLIGVIPDDEYIVISTNKGEPVIMSEEATSAKAYQNICRRILGEQVPFLNLDEKKGFLDKLKSVFTK